MRRIRTRLSAGLFVIFSLGFILCSSPTLPGELPPLTAVSPLWLGSLRPEGLELEQEQNPGWTFALNMAYGNTFATSSSVSEAHRQIDGVGQPLSQDAFDEAAGQGRDNCFIDTEAVRIDLAGVYHHPSGFFGGSRIPVWRIGHTFLDRWPLVVHRWANAGNGGRNDYPEKENIFRLASEGESVFIEEETALRLLSLDLWSGQRWEPGPHSWYQVWASASIPLSEKSAFGSKGFSWGLRCMAGTEFGRFNFSGGTGFTFQGGQVTTWAKAADTFHLWFGLSADLGKGIEAGIIARADGSVYRHASDGKVGRYTGEFAIGVALPVSETVDLNVAFGENFVYVGLPPDFSLQAALSWRLDSP